MRSVILLTVFAFAFTFAACSSKEAEVADDTPDTYTTKMVYYALPGCPYCAKITGIVRGMEKEFPGVVETDIENATTPENRNLLQNTYGVQSHGLVFLAPNTDKPQKVLDNHLIKEPEIRAALKEVLGPPKIR
ncbi:MAG: hypothetical protein HKN21_09595 [Candidatus Eisenbacteria bacterium]|uniref:Glutaredoxin n=1 Tax=Eiseniibacteriota bacterium TaxID=2212470 RepID=A0A7Y2E9P5_UNCEI|nr:hypothetical protein [Candidatus Eisenbacteria bacterium]